MQIIHRKDTWPPEEGTHKNCLLIYDDKWNDYSYKTTFHAVYFNNNGECIEIGEVKIYYYDYDKLRTEK